VLEHPHIDFDGDGRGDSYDTVETPGVGQEYVHHDHDGHIDAIAWDLNHDGLMDKMMTDDNHDGSLDTYHRDVDGDGIMDDSGPAYADHNDPVRHPYIDFDGDGRGDRYYSTADGRTDVYDHVDGHGHIDAKALDHNGDGLIDEMYVDSDHDGRFDTVLEDRTGDGIMDTARRL
jgi:hypothetical protein